MRDMASKARLVQERERLVAEIGLRDSLDQELVGYGEDQAGQGTLNCERARNAALRAFSETRLRQVEAALTRWENDDYGTCEVCGRPIGTARLGAVPYATRCAACEQRVETSARGRRHRRYPYTTASAAAVA